MPIPSIRCFPDPILRKKTRKVVRFGAATKRLLKTLADVMASQPSGIGIAAPQIGVNQRVAIVDVTQRVQGARRLYLVNPEILEAKKDRPSREGCMSLPDYTGQLKRYDWIRLKWQDERGEVHQGRFQGIEAVCIQHEVDHLNGVLFMDRVVSMKRDMIPRRAAAKRL